MSCNCSTAGGNTGVPFCSPLQGVMNSVIIVPKYGADGSLNAIDLENDTLDEAYFSQKINAVSNKDRWYPLPFMENIENVRAESLNETANSGNVYRIKQGVRTLSGAIFKQSPQYLARLEKWLCIDFGVYEIDNTGALAGTLSADGTKLYPRYVLDGSFDPNYVVATDTTVPKIMVNFQYDQDVQDSQIGLITSESLGGTYLLNLNGLFDVNLKASNVTDAGFTGKFTIPFGDALNPIAIEGLLVSDLTVFNKTTSASVTLTSLTDVVGEKGVYDVVYPAQSSGDVLSIIVTKEGYSDEPNTVAIP